MSEQEVNQAALDKANQQIHDLQREVTRLTLLERDYVNEIESLQNKQYEVERNWQNKLSSLEEEKRHYKKSETKAIEDAEQAILQKTDEIESLKKQLETSTQSRTFIDKSDEILSLQNRVNELENNIGILQKENQELHECVEELRKKSHIYEEAMNNLKDEHSSLTDVYKTKVEDLSEAKEMIEILQDQLMVSKAELQAIKCTDSDNNKTQGNSLFAEVDNKRVQLQDKVTKMKTHMEQTKQQLAGLEDQLHKIRMENGVLKRNWKKEIEERANDKHEGEEMYKDRINLLETQLDDYKRQLETRPLISASLNKDEALAFIEYQIEIKNKEIEKLLEKANKHSFENFMLSANHREVKKEASMWQYKYMANKEDVEKKDEIIANLEYKIREIEITNSERSLSTSTGLPEASPALTSSVISVSDMEGSVTDEVPFANITRRSKKSRSFMLDNIEGVRDNGDEQSNKENMKNVKKKVQFMGHPKEAGENAQTVNIIRKNVKTIVCQPTVMKKREF